MGRHPVRRLYEERPVPRVFHVPAELYARDGLVVRPRDLAERWAKPKEALRRLGASGVVRPVAHGYWLVPPAEHLTDPTWRPEIEAVGLAVPAADYGVDKVALMGVSAARHHGALPRAVSVAVVAVPRQRPALDTAFGRDAARHRHGHGY